MRVRPEWRQPISLVPIFGLYALISVAWMAAGTGGDGRSLAIGLSHVPPEVAGVAVAWLASLRSGDPATKRAWRLIGAALGFWEMYRQMIRKKR